MTTIPTITIQDIHDYVGDASFQRAQSYFSGDAIYNTRRQSMSLKARCQGSQPSAYHVQVTFDSEGIANSNCTCPLGSRCKHVAALLLTWLQNPGEFLEQQEVDAVLEVAQAAEETRPREAIAIYQQQVEKLIAQRGRESYQVACRHLLKIRALYEKLDESEQWASYITGLRDSNRGLRALKDELASAGL